MFFIEKARTWYGRFERPISSLSLIAGFVFDIVTLQRVDELWENIWVVGHLLIVGIFIILIHLKKSEVGDEKNPSRAHFWYVNILQFFFGGILSTYLVFYFRSADILVTWPFIALLAIAFIANESFKKHYVRLSFQISLFFLSIYSFAIFLVPVILHKIGTWVFILSGILSLVFIAIFLFLLFHIIKDKFKESRKLILGLISGIFILVNFLYFTNLIPPIPLSLKDAGIYHSIVKNTNADYVVKYEKKNWMDYFDLYQDYTEVVGEPIYAYSAIFSPSGLNIKIFHELEYYDPVAKSWVTKGLVYLPVVGGRSGGFRTYSMFSNLSAGKWRVDIETEQKQIIGRLRFRVVENGTEPVLSSMIK